MITIDLNTIRNNCNCLSSYLEHYIDTITRGNVLHVTSGNCSTIMDLSNCMCDYNCL